MDLGNIINRSFIKKYQVLCYLLHPNKLKYNLYIIYFIIGNIRNNIFIPTKIHLIVNQTSGDIHIPKVHQPMKKF